jgi:hypothetical protein
VQSRGSIRDARVEPAASGGSRSSALAAGGGPGTALPLGSAGSWRGSVNESGRGPGGTHVLGERLGEVRGQRAGVDAGEGLRIRDRAEVRVLVVLDRRLELLERLQVRVSGRMAGIGARRMRRHGGGRGVLPGLGGVGRGSVVAAGGKGGAAPVKGASGASGRHGGRRRPDQHRSSHDLGVPTLVIRSDVMGPRQAPSREAENVLEGCGRSPIWSHRESPSARPRDISLGPRRSLFSCLFSVSSMAVVGIDFGTLHSKVGVVFFSSSPRPYRVPDRCRPPSRNRYHRQRGLQSRHPVRPPPTRPALPLTPFPDRWLPLAPNNAPLANPPKRKRHQILKTPSAV